MIRVETLVIGAGIIGSSVAMHLSRLGMTGVRVVDFDLEGALSSSELNAGGVRATLSQPLNIQMSQVSIDYFAKMAAETGYRACGYLWLHRGNRWAQALEARDLQLKMGWSVEAWSVEELRRRMPWIDKTDDLAGAVFAPRDGLVNPNLIKNHYRDLAKKADVIFEDRVLIRFSERNSKGIRIVGEKFETVLTPERKKNILLGIETGAGQSVEYQVDRVVNCAGAWGGKVAAALGYTSPSRAVRRQISLFDYPKVEGVDLTSYGMVIDPSGVYFHPEATFMLAGFANHDEPTGFNYHYDGEAFFTEVLWPALYERSTAFERLKHLSGWAGLYEVSPDEGAILGQVTQGELGKSAQIFEAHSFSGHGVMHSYSAGLCLAELMVGGCYETIDATPLSGSRFETGKLLQEGLVI